MSELRTRLEKLQLKALRYKAETYRWSRSIRPSTRIEEWERWIALENKYK